LAHRSPAMKVKLIVAVVALAVLSVAALCACLIKAGASASERPEAVCDTALEERQSHRAAASHANGGSDVSGMSGAGRNVVDERCVAQRAAVEARRREREAFMKMSLEEQRQFREQKRAEMLARRKEDPRRMGDARNRRQHGAGEAVAAAAAGDAAQSEESSERTARAELEELRAAALKARAEYEDSMGETRAANYRRRSVNYWMNRVKRQRERAAERELRHSSDVMGADAGASAADSQEQKTKGKAE